ncbi:hypothetical protein [Hymenobacter cheonanensis]|uniref:hypothetical protein n=1 Tax=Hymenobacter sp. CA2-7 TaxID=3063993 RepID=UPI002712FA8B|nr:hypothetical protein [Hymenobacter sp. CA2-7]MDO7886268.1 hypothetical protein [Hymenobacter sp. CA2-7]
MPSSTKPVVLLRVVVCSCLALPGLAQTGAATPGSEASTLTLLRLNQPPCAVPTARSVIKARLAYRLAAGEQSDYGFAVSIKFREVTPGHTFSKGRPGQVSITQRADTLTIEYPMAAILADTRLSHPVTCYFYLHRNTAPGRSRVIAQTPPIIFKECQ